MQVDRRKFLQYLAVARAVPASVLAGSQGVQDMYGLIVKLTIIPGKREEMIKILREGAVEMPGGVSATL